MLTLFCKYNAGWNGVNFQGRRTPTLKAVENRIDNVGIKIRLGVRTVQLLGVQLCIPYGRTTSKHYAQSCDVKTTPKLCACTCELSTQLLLSSSPTWLVLLALPCWITHPSALTSQLVHASRVQTDVSPPKICFILHVFVIENLKNKPP